MRKAVQILLLIIIAAALIALVGFLFEWLVLPLLPAGLQSRLVAFLAAFVLVVGLLAGMAQIASVVRDLISQQDPRTLPAPLSSAIEELAAPLAQPRPLGDQIEGDKVGGDKVGGDKVGHDQIKIETAYIHGILPTDPFLDEPRDPKQKILYRIRRLRDIHEPDRLILEYWELRADEPNWQDPVMLQELQIAADEVFTPKMLWAATEGWFAQSQDDWALRCAKLAVERYPTDGGSPPYQSLSLVLEYRAKPGDPAVPLPTEQEEELTLALHRLRSECEGGGGRDRADLLLQELGRRQGRLLGASGIYLRDFVRWVAGQPAPPLRRATRVEQWLRAFDFQYSPFSGEWAEDDPSLQTCHVAEVFEKARGRKSVLVVGPPGSGKSATASMLAWNCLMPIDAPREPGAFPVRYFFPNEKDAAARFSQRDHLEWLCRDVAVAMARYVAHDNDGFFRLKERESFATLLSLWHESPEQLKTQLRGYGPRWGTSNRLVDDLPYRPLSRAGMSDQQYLDLLEARPWGFDCIYLLADPLSVIEEFDPQVMAQCVRRLLGLTLWLRNKEVYLKLFLPDEVGRHLGSPKGISFVPLEWDDTRLRAMLRNRLRAASKGKVESLEQLCQPSDQRLDEWLIAAAENSPRRLLRAGQALLEAHVGTMHQGREPESIPPLAPDWALSMLER